MSEAAEFECAVNDLLDAYRRGLRAFAEWYAKEWQMSLDDWKKSYAENPPGGEEYLAGFNAGVEGVLRGLDAFLDDHNL